MKNSNLYLYRSGYRAEVDWKKGRVISAPPRQVEDDGYGHWFLPPEERPFRGLSSRFANFSKTWKKDFKKDFEIFVAEFGLLGITGLPEDAYKPPMYGESWEEEIDWWLHYAGEVYRLLRLYRIIRRARVDKNFDAEGALDEIIIFEQAYKVSHTCKLQDNGQYNWTEHKEETPFVKAVWKENGIETGQVFPETMLPIDAAPYVLASTISRNLAGGVILGMGKVTPSKKSPIGYSIAEQRYTNYLLAAIYNDLWELIRNEKPVEICAHSECANIFVPQRKTGEYCSDACKQAAYRKRKAETQKNNGQ